MATLKDLADKVRGFLQSNPTPAGFFGPRIQQAAGNFMRSPVPQQFQQPARQLINFNQRLQQSPIGLPSRVTQNIGVGRIGQPILDARQDFKQPGIVPKAMGALKLGGAAWNLSVPGFATSMAESGVAGGLRSARTKQPLGQSISQAQRDPYTGIVSGGLGIGGIPGMIGDIAAGNPKAVAKIGKLRGVGQAFKKIGLNKTEARLADSYDFLRSVKQEILTNKSLSIEKYTKLSKDVIEEALVHKKLLGLDERQIRYKAVRDLQGLVDDLVTKSEGFLSQRQQAYSLGYKSNVVSNRKGSYKAPLQEPGVVAQTGTIKSPQLLENGTPIRTTANQVSLKSSSSSIPQKGKLNLNRLRVEGPGKVVLENIENQVKPTVIGNKQVVNAAKTATGAKGAMTDAQMQDLMANQLKNRQVVVDLANKFNTAKAGGATDQELGKIVLEMANQSRVARQGGTYAGRILQAQNIIADESAAPMQKILALLDNAGVKEERYLKDAVRVNWDNPGEVVGFYRKFVPPKFGEILDEVRYSNMLSSPLTHITNIASNAIQTGLVAPVEKTLSGVLDFGKTVLTGKERQYYTSAGLDYTGGAVKALPQAFKKAWGVLSGKEVTIRPDFEHIPTGTKGLAKLYTTPLRALEAMDQFFKTLVEGGVTRQLQKGPQKFSVESIADTASKEASYRLFRQAFDPNGELGQGGVLKLWDKWNSGIQQIRRLPGGKWFLPFLQTPTNILKQGVEFSPLGITTIPGAKRPIEQLSKAIIGTGVMVGAYQLGAQGLLSWDAPTGEKERDLYYAAGLQPYSVKVGDKWVSFSKLGPLSYPIAMASALANAEKKNPDQGQMENIGSAVGGMLKFFGDQSYVRSIGDLVEAVQGGGNITGKAFSSEAANIAGQLVPYKSFLTWLGRTIDPVYRKANTFGEKMVKDLPVLGQGLEPYTDLGGQPSKRDFPLLNAVSPYKVTQEKGPQEDLYRSYEQEKISKERISSAKDVVAGTKGELNIANNLVYWDEESGTAKSIDLSFQPKKPTLTGLEELDKKAVSKFNSDITKKANNIYDLYKLGKLSQEEANNQLSELKTLKDMFKKPKKPKKPKKIAAKKISVKGVKMALPKKSKIQTIKVPNPPKAKVTKSKKSKTIAVKPIKTTKIKGLVAGKKLV